MHPLKTQLFHSVVFTLISLSHSSIFTITNNCPYTIWPGTLAGSGTPQLPTTGFRLDPGQMIRIPSAPGWSGRIWARTGCTFDPNGAGKCQTGDCGGRLECNGNGAAPPTSLFEITLGVGDGKDFYDVSIVDGYNLPLVASPVGAFGSCNATGCASDINIGCPKELQVVAGGGGGENGVVGCKSGCEAFGIDEYCCSGEFGSPATCRPSLYSAIFKQACPKAYSYAFDDSTSTFTCKAYEYSILFCPGKRKSEALLTPPAPLIPPMNPLTPLPMNPLIPPTIDPLTPPPMNPLTPLPMNPLIPPTIDPLTPLPMNPLIPPIIDPLIPIDDPIRKESVKVVSSSDVLLPRPAVIVLLILNLIL